MDRTRIVASGAAFVLVFALFAAAQQSSTTGSHETHGFPTVESHLKVLAEKLDLTSDQQSKAKPILQVMHDSMGKLGH
ncbi:MAG: hypothetical protein ACRD3B_01300 [Candidatus Sulfotelmatobacter sp.]